MKRFALFLALILGTPALAQTVQPLQTPSSGEQALSNELMRQLQASVNAQAQVIDLQRQLAAAQAKIKELEAKVPKKDDEKK